MQSSRILDVGIDSSYNSQRRCPSWPHGSSLAATKQGKQICLNKKLRKYFHGNTRSSTHSNMTQLRRKLIKIDVKWMLLDRVMFFRRFFRYIRNHIFVCSMRKPIGYHRLSHCSSTSVSPSIVEAGLANGDAVSMCNGYETDSDLVALKISILGDCQIGKTSFVVKYVGCDEEKKCLEMNGLNLVDKMFFIRGARIAYSIWDVGGDHQSLDHVPIACKDASAILIMFDLTSRSTLNSVLGWYKQARKYNQTAIPILIGTKFDDFAHLPLAVQWTIVNQV
ncbi:hypothetical protein AQUCO_07700059v1 [Aquilegia coerulea]|uniref:Septum-promoting GTP-binding protein 1 n=1 Tax=Aquilegia coerulea TaxID=218851 RepID=A0A2G5C8A7_AQUCA|nr:hypothetical protein AQUCO_07700059v1 [Aquilegia coerulea]